MSVTMVTANERLAYYESQIADAFHQIGNALRAIRDEELYRISGFGSFDDYVTSRWGRSSSWARQMISAGGVHEHIAQKTGIELINARHARELTQFDIELRPIITKTAYARAESEQRAPTTADIKTIGQIMTDLVATGSVDIGDGSMSAIEAAISTEDYERVMRQREHVRGHRPPAYKTRLTSDPSGVISLEVPEQYRGQNIIVYIQLEDA